MREIFLVILGAVFFSLFVVTSASADFQEGYAALQKREFATALNEFRLLAERGDPEGQWGLGIMYGNGYGVPEDDSVALTWHARAAEQGYAPAQLQSGIMYGNGYGVPENDQTSFKWYMLAANQDDPEASWNVGIYYETGLGVATDMEAARIWYGRAAMLGYPDAMYSLGRMYVLGIGTPKDEIEAYKWLLLGSLMKEPLARSGLDNLGPTMSDADILLAVKRADKFRESVERRLEASAAAENAATATAEAGASPIADQGTTLEDKLGKVKKLLEAGLITREEAAEKRKELLEDL